MAQNTLSDYLLGVLQTVEAYEQFHPLTYGPKSPFHTELKQLKRKLNTTITELSGVPYSKVTTERLPSLLTPYTVDDRQESLGI